MESTLSMRQKPNVKIYKTVERLQITPVFGTTCPPKGLSGFIRDLSYRHSEDKMRHWLGLMLADRINMVEGWFEDIAQGKKPAILPRMEFRLSYRIKENPVKAALIGGSLVLATLWVLRRSQTRS